MEQITRRQMLMSCSRSLASILLTAHGLGCQLPASVEISNKPKDIGLFDALGFVQGRTTLKDAVAILRKKGASGISLSGGLDAKNEKTVVHALCADYTGAVFVFKDAVLSRILLLNAEKGSDKEMYVKMGNLEDSNAVIVVSESMRYRGSTGILILAMDPGKRIHISYDYFPDWIYGMKDPLIIGNDIARGVTFVARKATEIFGEYTPWYYGAVIKFDGNKLNVETKIMQKFLDCECIWNWYNYPPGKRKKDELVAPFLDSR